MSKHREEFDDEREAQGATSILHNEPPDSPVNAVAVSELAYRRWLERGCPLGSPDEDWFAAEEELRSRVGTTQNDG